MCLLEFIKKYFSKWKIATFMTCGTSHGYIKLHDNETFIKIYFIMNGAKVWTDHRVTIDRIEGCDNIFEF